MQPVHRMPIFRTLVLVLGIVCLFALPAVAPARSLLTDHSVPSLGSPSPDLDGGFYRPLPDTMGGPGGGSGGSGPGHGGGGGNNPDGDPDDTDFRALRMIVSFFYTFLRS